MNLARTRIGSVFEHSLDGSGNKSTLAINRNVCLFLCLVSLKGVQALHSQSLSNLSHNMMLSAVFARKS